MFIINRGEFGWSEGMAAIEVIQNERLIELQGKSVFLSCVT